MARKPALTRKEQKVATRARVLASARACFRDADERDVSMTDIAKRAGTSVGALYIHFSSRERLVDAVVGELAGELIDGLRRALVSCDVDDLDSAVRALARTYLGLLRDIRPFFPLIALQSARIMNADVLRVGGGGAPLHQMLAATFASLAASVEIRGDIALLASGVAALWRSAALSYASRSVGDEARIAESLAEMTLAILGRASPALLEADATRVMRGMAIYLKTPAST